MKSAAPHVIWLKNSGKEDVPRVGGKNASLGEMIRNLGKQGIHTPPGFATTTDAYWAFVDFNGFADAIAATFRRLDAGEIELSEAGETYSRALPARQVA